MLKRRVSEVVAGETQDLFLQFCKLYSILLLKIRLRWLSHLFHVLEGNDWISLSLLESLLNS